METIQKTGGLLGSIDVSADKAILIRGKINKLLKPPCKRVLLINPPSTPGEYYNFNLAKRKRYFAYPPYGLGILSAHLNNRGYIPNILDLNLDILTFIDKLGNERGFNFSCFLEKCVSHKIERFNPDLVGITSMFTMSHDVMLQIARDIKQLNPRLPIIAGGVHPTNTPELILRDSKNIDFIATHEGDVSFVDMLDFSNHPKGEFTPVQLATLIDDRFVEVGIKNQPGSNEMDIIPDYLDLPINRYSSLGEIGAYRFMRPTESIASTSLSTRGCRAKCTFCSVSNFNALGVRSRSVISVIDEIERLRDRYNVGHIMWLDDDLFFSAKRAISLFNEMTKRNLNITWDASNGVIASAVSEELIHAASESGCNGMHVGIESGNSQILKKIRKPSGVKQFIKAGSILNKYPQIFTKGFLIIGFPNETLGNIQDTINLAVEMSLDWYTISNLTPLPSTEIYEQMVQQGLISEDVTDSGKVNYGSSHTGKQQDKEGKERYSAKDFIDYFETDLDVVPTADMLDDIWFHMDYKVNYQPILFDTFNADRLPNLKLFLEDVSHRMTSDNPIPNLFLGLVEEKLGNIIDAQNCFNRTKKFVDRSKYWQMRFNGLGLYRYIN